MGVGTQGMQGNNGENAGISSNDKFLNADGEYITNFEKRLD